MKKVNLKLNVLGCGKMGTLLVEAISREFSNIDFFTYTPSKTSAKNLAKKVGGKFCKNLTEMDRGDVYLIACKPQQFSELANDLKPIIDSSAFVISIMAGVSTSKITHSLGVKKVVRVMPNTPVSVGFGVYGLFASNEVTRDEVDSVVSWLRSTGKVYTFPKENQIDLLTPFSGSGPAYIFEFARIMINKMQDYDFEEDMAQEIIGETFLGASKLLLDGKVKAEELRNNVTSKGGVTFEALKVFEENNLEEILTHAIDKAYRRALELA